MSGPVAVVRDGHRTFFKWHRGRRSASDPVFTGRRILEGMAMGASVEVDLVVLGDGGMAVLHDHLAIERETTGRGSARAMSREAMRALQLRGNDGAPIAEQVMVLEDLCRLLVETPPHPDALLQLDYKENQGPLDRATVEAFAEAVRPVGRSMILSSGEAAAVALLADATPGLHVGYDPCHGASIAKLRADGDFAGFVAEAITASPKAEMIYLHHQVVTMASDRGFNVVAAFHSADRRIDAYTINRADDAGRALAERLLALKVDQITTDDPEGLSALLG